jgi:hypothetical protein
VPPCFSHLAVLPSCHRAERCYNRCSLLHPPPPWHAALCSTLGTTASTMAANSSFAATGFPLLRSLYVPTERVITISCSRRPRSAAFRATTVTGAPRRRRCRGLGRRRTWSGYLGPSRAKPRAPVGAPDDGVASTPLQRRRCGLPLTNRELRRTSSV